MGPIKRRAVSSMGVEDGSKGQLEGAAKYQRQLEGGFSFADDLVLQSKRDALQERTKTSAHSLRDVPPPENFKRSSQAAFLDKFRSSHTDILTGKTFASLMRDDFQACRPYILARVERDNGSRRRILYADGRTIFDFFIQYGKKTVEHSIEIIDRRSGDRFCNPELYYTLDVHADFFPISDFLTMTSKSNASMMSSLVVKPDDSDPLAQAEQKLWLHAIFTLGKGVVQNTPFAESVFKRINVDDMAPALGEALNDAASIQDIGILNHFLNLGADPNTHARFSHILPIAMAARHQWVEHASLLLAAGANPSLDSSIGSAREIADNKQCTRLQSLFFKTANRHGIE